MLRFLILDLLQRLWRVYAGVCALLALTWAVAGVLPLDPGFPMGLSMMATFVLGPTIAVTNFAATEILLLPVSRRDLWRARWFVGGVLSCAATLAAKLAGVTAGAVFAADRSLGLTQVAISSLLDFAYAGWLAGVLLMLRPAWGGLRGRPGRIISAIAVDISTLMFAGGALWGFLLRSYLPTEWWHVRGPVASLLIAGIGISLAAGFYVPPPGVRQASRDPEARASQPPTIVFTWPPHGSFSGLRLFLLESTGTAAGFCLLLILTLVVVDTVTGPTTGVIEVLRSLTLLPFEAGAGYIRLFTLAVFGAMAMNGLSPTRDLCFRHLRTLPLDTRGLTLVLLGRRGLGWLGIWIILIGLHLAALRSLPDTLRPELFVACVGADALLYAMQVRWQLGGRLTAMAIMAALVLAVGLVFVPPLGFLPSGIAAAALVAFGLAAGATAVRVSDRTLRSSSALYAPGPGAAAGLL